MQRLFGCGLQGKNKALLFKWLWRLGDTNHGRRQQLINNMYQPTYINGLTLLHCLETLCHQHGMLFIPLSAMIQQLLLSWRIFVTSKLEMERQIHFWTDRWLTMWDSKRVISIALCTFNKYINLFDSDEGLQTWVLDVKSHLESKLKLLRTVPVIAATTYIDRWSQLEFKQSWFKTMGT